MPNRWIVICGAAAFLLLFGGFLNTLFLLTDETKQNKIPVRTVGIFSEERILFQIETQFWFLKQNRSKSWSRRWEFFWGADFVSDRNIFLSFETKLIKIIARTGRIFLEVNSVSNRNTLSVFETNPTEISSQTGRFFLRRRFCFK